MLLLTIVIITQIRKLKGTNIETTRFSIAIRSLQLESVNKGNQTLWMKINDTIKLVENKENQNYINIRSTVQGKGSHLSSLEKEYCSPLEATSA